MKPVDKMNPYIIKQGDYLKKVAFILGFNADTVWNDPKNADLKSKRTPDLLYPGDVLWVPDAVPRMLPIVAGATNRYVAKVPMIELRLCFRSDEKALANEPYTVEGVGTPREGATDGEGDLALTVPVHIRELEISFPRQNIVYPVRIGDMDPIDEMSGIRKRLQHLGYFGQTLGEESDRSIEEDAEVRDRQAILAFQRARGLEPTGSIDEATKAKLLEAHGS